MHGGPVSSVIVRCASGLPEGFGPLIGIRTDMKPLFRIIAWRSKSCCARRRPRRGRSQRVAWSSSRSAWRTRHDLSGDQKVVDNLPPITRVQLRSGADRREMRSEPQITTKHRIPGEAGITYPATEP